MDAYSSLLNLNFMASLRTGNVVADMLIAMLIPFVSGLIAQFFREWWPGSIEKVVRLFQGRDVETLVAANREARHGSSAELDENGFLQSILMNYVATTVKPTYQFGSYQYKRLLTAIGNGSDTRNQTLADTLKALYTIQTVPTKDREVEINRNVSLRVLDNAEEADNLEGGNSGGGGGGDRGGDGGDKDKRNKLKQKTTMLVFRTHQSFFDKEDAVMALAQGAFEKFKNEQKQAANTERYLYQPLMPSGVGGAEASEDQNEPPRCQRYKLSHEKTFATLFFPEKERLIRLIGQFETKTGKFAVPGFPRKLILLLYGPPGTGKTSLVKAIAAFTGRNIFSIPLSRVKTNHQLMEYMFDSAFRVKNAPRERYSSSDPVEKLQTERVIYMLEDVDAASDVVLRKGALRDNAEVAPPTTTGAAARKEENVAATSDAETRQTTETPIPDETATDGDASGGSDRVAEDVPATKKPILIREDDNSSSSNSDNGDKSDAEGDAEEGPDTDKEDTDDAGSESNKTSGGSTSNSKKTKRKQGKKATSAPKVDRVTITDDGKSFFAADKDKLSIKGLLEAFGGILDAPGRIVVMTTNHIEHLDPALLRPGVVTMKLHMGNFDAQCGVAMVRHYFATQYRNADGPDSGTGKEDPEAQAKPLWNEALLAEVARVIDEAKCASGGFSPAEVEQLCAENETIEDLLVALKRGSRREVF